jgi:hypothetical protein
MSSAGALGEKVHRAESKGRENNTMLFRFTPFVQRTTHWGKIRHRPFIPNMATILPPDLPEETLKLLMLRMQMEETMFKLNNVDSEGEYGAWLENNLDGPAWDGDLWEATKSRARLCLRCDFKRLIEKFDDMFPPIIPRAPVSDVPKSGPIDD